MTKLGRTTIVLAASGAVLIGGTAAWAAYTWTHHTSVPVVSAAAAEPSVKVIGEVTGLLPGQSRSLEVAIGNGNEFAVRVTKIGGGSLKTASGCPAWAVRVTPASADAYAITVPGRSTRTVTVQVAMEDWADQKCAGQRFTLDLTTFMTAAVS